MNNKKNLLAIMATMGVILATGPLSAFAHNKGLASFTSLSSFKISKKNPLGPSIPIEGFHEIVIYSRSLNHVGGERPKVEVLFSVDGKHFGNVGDINIAKGHLRIPIQGTHMRIKINTQDLVSTTNVSGSFSVAGVKYD